ncbi:MAG: TonB-dependent receptor plug domain-containing protein [Gemmatimonadaceae bacterium]
MAIAVPAGAQKASLRADTAAHVAAAAPDTDVQSGDMQEFELRRKQGAGYFITRAQLSRDRDRPLGDILTAHIPGVRVVYGAHLNSRYLVSLRGEGPNALVSDGGTSLCYVQVFVNGSYIVDGDISWINPDDVAGIEFYDVTRTPPAYRRPDGSCGVLLVWSRASGG